MNFDNILSMVKEEFSPRKKIDFEEEGLHFELEPLTSIDEIKILTALKSVEDTQYIEGLKRHSLACAIKKINDIDLSGDDVIYEEDGKNKTKSKYLFMIDFLGKWPSALIDSIFDAFSELNKGIEVKIKKGIKFEKFLMSEPVPEEKTPLLRPLDEETPTPELTPEERLEKKVAKEIEEADLMASQTEQDMVKKFQR